MNSWHRAAATTTIAAFLAGCQSSAVSRRSIPTRPIDTQSPVVAASGASTNDAPARRADPSGATSVVQLTAHEAEPRLVPAAESAPIRLTFAQAIEAGLEQNPDLITQRQAEPVSEAALGVAQTYPFNPWVQVQATPYQNAPDGRTGTTYHYVLLMQQIQLAHQQRYREEGASAVLNSTRWNIVQAQLLNMVQTERLYFTALYQKGVRDLMRINADNNDQLLTILERQLKAGQATGADVSIVRLDARSTRQQADLAEANYQTSLLDLKRQLGLPISSALELSEELTQWNWLSADADRLASITSSPHGDMKLATENADELIASLAGCRPDVLAARADLDAARANCQFADASRTPDLQIGPYYQRTDSGMWFLGFRAQIDIPVLNDGTPLLHQRYAELRQRVVVWQQLQTRVELEARAAISRYERARQLVTTSAAANGAALPVELQRLEEQFQAGEVDMLRVFQARTSLIQSRRAYLDTLNELAQSAVAITAATGIPMQSLTSSER